MWEDMQVKWQIKQQLRLKLWQMNEQNKRCVQVQVFDHSLDVLEQDLDQAVEHWVVQVDYPLVDSILVVD